MNVTRADGTHSPDMAAHLVLFFTSSTSLRTWDEVGMLDRETALYRRLVAAGIGVTFVTYGKRDDLSFVPQLGGIRVVCNRWNLPHRGYIELLTRYYPAFWGRRAIFKSNQIKGAEVALTAAERFRRPFLARCGYLHSDFAEREHGLTSSQASSARALERRVFASATRISVTTVEMARRIAQDYSIGPDRIAVMPNYVDSQFFGSASLDAVDSPRHGKRRAFRVIFVGRLADQKNLPALLDAIEGLDLELLIVGDGALSETLRATVSDRRLLVTFLGSVPHTQLPALFASADLFVLPSRYEGHPKALLEAMAAGVAVIGADVPGIREAISHGKTGWLSPATAEGLRASIQHLMSDESLRTRLGAAGRAAVHETCSLNRVVSLELELLRQIHGGGVNVASAIPA